MRTILLLTISNIFMTFAWYGHLKFRGTALWKAIMVSWGIAFFEYCFQVPGNRLGFYEFNSAQLKTIQEVITLSVFSVFSIVYARAARSPRPVFSQNGEEAFVRGGPLPPLPPCYFQ